jgi:hypothetical protein
VQGRDALLVAYLWNRMLRVVSLHDPGAADGAPSYYGSWIGHRDGAALVLEGAAFNPDTVLDATGLPHSEALRLTQRLSLSNGGGDLEIRTTVDDPKDYVRSWSTVQHFHRVKNGVVSENICRPVKRDSGEAD